jgi:hypothetical protein
MATLVALVSLSVLLILGALYSYFGKQVESEFNKKLLAQKGQVEIILKNRFSEIRQVLQDLSSDNIILVTVMLEAKTQLQDRIIQNYPPKDGVYCFVKKIGETSPAPARYSMGTGYALYDLTQDHNLKETIHQSVDGDISIIKSGHLLNFATGTSLPLSASLRQKISRRHEFHPLSKNVIVSKLDGFGNLFFQSSMESLIRGKLRSGWAYSQF